MMNENQIDDAVCDIMQEHGSDGHVDGHEELTAFVMKCIAAERERCATMADEFASIAWNDARSEHWSDEFELLARNMRQA